MTDAYESDEKLPQQLDDAYQAAVSEVAYNEMVYQSVADALGRIAREKYPDLGDWDGLQLRRLAEIITTHANQFTTELADLNQAGQDAS